MDKSLSHIDAMNYEVDQFRSAFSLFRSNVHAIDESLCINLYQVVCEIENFLDSKPKEIAFPRKDQLTADFKVLGIQKTFFCNKCDCNVGSAFTNAWKHVKLYKHENRKRNERSTQISRQAKLDNKILPKKAKALIQRDLHSFLTENLAVAKKLTNLPDYIEIENELLKLIRPAFVDQSIKIYFFGSRLSGLGTIYSDLDIFIDIGGVFHNFENRPSPDTKKKLQIVQGLLRKDPQWSQLIAIENARVPILKILYKPKSTNCDIGFSNSLGFCNTKLLKYLLELQPIGKALAFFFKKWIERSKLNEHITTYSAVLLVVFYLQITNLLPSIKTLQEGLDAANEIGPWMAAFNEKSLAELTISEAPYYLEYFKKEVKLFFKFYISFDFKQKLLCPYLGQAISIEDLEVSPLLPRYVKYIEAEKDNNDALFKVAHINVQDPFQLNHNITKAVPATVVLLLKQYFELSQNAMTDGEIDRK